MSVENARTSATALDPVVARVVEVDGIAMSALCAEVPDPRAVLVAVHGGATTARYYDAPGHPELSLMRAAASAGFTVLAVDRPGYGASGPRGEVFDPPRRRVDACYATVEALLGDAPRGAGVFLVGHSAGCDLALRMAADERGADLLGLELAGTGVRKFPEAERVIAEVHRTRDAGLIRELLWHPRESYPPEIHGGRGLGAASPRYEAAVVRDWPGDFARLAAEVRVPVRYTYAEHESMWRRDDEAVREIARFFTAAPLFRTHRALGSGHNISLGYGAPDYHLDLLALVEECARFPAERPPV
ncbi:alpha/beta hydrolase [Nocardia takedensis]